MASSRRVINLVAGEEALVLFTLPGLDLNGCTIIGRLKGATGPVVAMPTSIVDSPHGKFTLRFVAIDLVRGRYKLEFLITDADGNQSTRPAKAPIYVVVRDALA